MLHHSETKRLRTMMSRFLHDQSGSMTIQLAMYFAIAAVGIALVAPQFLSSSSERIATSSPGIDQVTTGSISGKKRYIIRKSILDLEQSE